MSVPHRYTFSAWNKGMHFKYFSEFAIFLLFITLLIIHIIDIMQLTKEGRRYRVKMRELQNIICTSNCDEINKEIELLYTQGCQCY